MASVLLLAWFAVALLAHRTLARAVRMPPESRSLLVSVVITVVFLLGYASGAQGSLP